MRRSRAARTQACPERPTIARGSRGQQPGGEGSSRADRANSSASAKRRRACASSSLMGICRGYSNRHCPPAPLAARPGHDTPVVAWLEGGVTPRGRRGVGVLTTTPSQSDDGLTRREVTSADHRGHRHETTASRADLGISSSRLHSRSRSSRRSRPDRRHRRRAPRARLGRGAPRACGSTRDRSRRPGGPRSRKITHAQVGASRSGSGAAPQHQHGDRGRSPDPPAPPRPHPRAGSQDRRRHEPGPDDQERAEDQPEEPAPHPAGPERPEDPQEGARPRRPP